MFSMPKIAIERRIRALRARLGNLPEAEMKAALEEGMEDQWAQIMGKAEAYVQGGDVLEKGGHFSAASTGNWFLIADAAGVNRIPAEVISVVSPILLFDAYTNLLNAASQEQIDAFFARNDEAFSRFVNDIQRVGENQIIRYDTGADSRLKAQLALGRSEGTIPEFRGYRKTPNALLPDFDERIVEHLMENPENQSPVWARDWVEPRMSAGDRGNAFSYMLKPEDVARASDPMTPEDQAGKIDVNAERPDYGDVPSEGTLFPHEWRVFVRDGEVKGVGNYYTQISRAKTPEDEQDAAETAMAIVAMAQRMVDLIKDKGAIPHHPQYEDPSRKGFSPDAGHFTLDFMETADGRIVLVDAGVGHLRNPPFGAHPVSFGAAKEPEGVAFGLGDVRSFEEVAAIVRRDATPSLNGM